MIEREKEKGEKGLSLQAVVLQTIIYTRCRSVAQDRDGMMRDR